MDCYDVNRGKKHQYQLLTTNKDKKEYRRALTLDGERLSKMRKLLSKYQATDKRVEEPNPDKKWKELFLRLSLSKIETEIRGWIIQSRRSNLLSQLDMKISSHMRTQSMLRWSWRREVKRLTNCRRSWNSYKNLKRLRRKNRNRMNCWSSSWKSMMMGEISNRRWIHSFLKRNRLTNRNICQPFNHNNIMLVQIESTQNRRQRTAGIQEAAVTKRSYRWRKRKLLR